VAKQPVETFLNWLNIKHNTRGLHIQSQMDAKSQDNRRDMQDLRERQHTILGLNYMKRENATLQMSKIRAGGKCKNEETEEYLDKFL